MAAKASFINGASELTFSSDARTPAYLGQPTFVSTTQSVFDGVDTYDAGFSTFTITYTGQIIPAVKLVNTYTTRIVSCTQSGSVWTIHVDHGTTLDADGFVTQTLPTVYVFGFPVSLVGTVGIAIYDASGVLRCDLSRRPLWFTDRLPFPASSTGVTIGTARTVPAIVGNSSDFRRRRTGTALVNYIFYFDDNAFTISASGLLVSRVFVQVQKILNTGAGTASSTVYRAADAYLIEATGL